jgi:hypothetical protein
MRLFTLCLAAAVLPAVARAQDDNNTLELTIGNGPHRGTYVLSPSETSCLHSKDRKQFGVAYYDETARVAQRLHRVIAHIPELTNAGPQHGYVHVMFGEAKGKPIAVYKVAIPSESKGPLTVTKKGSVVSVAFEGVTPGGIALRVSATCRTMDEF